VSSPAVPWQRLLTVEILQLHAIRSSCHSRPCRTQLNCRLNYIMPFLLSPLCRAQLNLLRQTVLFITSRHGPYREHTDSTVILLFRECSFSREHVCRAVAHKRSMYIRLLHSNGSTCYNNKTTAIYYRYRKCH
jgi:hypothetical protein